MRLPNPKSQIPNPKFYLAVYLLIGTAIIVASLVWASTARGQCAGGVCSTCPGGQCNLPGNYRPTTYSPRRPSASSVVRSPQAAQGGAWTYEEHDPSRLAARTNSHYPAVVRVVGRKATAGAWRPAGDGTYARDTAIHDCGTGVLVYSDPVRDVAGVLSAWHVIRDGGYEEYRVYFPDGRIFVGRLDAADKTRDLILLAIRCPTGVRPMPLADRRPAVGEQLITCGYGSGRFHVSAGPVTKYVSWQENGPLGWIQVGSRNVPGDSGGPILDRRGCVVGIAWGAAEGRANGTVCTVIRESFRRLAGLISTEICGRRPVVAVQRPSAAANPQSEIPNPKSEIPTDHAAAGADSTPETSSAPALLQIQAELRRLNARIDALAAAKQPDAEQLAEQVSALKIQLHKVIIGQFQQQPTAAELAEQIRAALPPITVETQTPDGKIIESIDVPLGGTLPLILKPVRRASEK